MKRDELDRELRRIKVRTPWFFWVRCDICRADFKHVKMWNARAPRADSRGIIGYHNVDACMECLPDEESVLKRLFPQHVYQLWRRKHIVGPLVLP